jgi:hypothetical protein
VLLCVRGHFLPHHVSRSDWVSFLAWVLDWKVESATHVTTVMVKANGVSTTKKRNKISKVFENNS